MSNTSQNVDVTSLANKLKARFLSYANPVDSDAKIITDKSVSLGMINEINSEEFLTLSQRNYVNPDSDKKSNVEELQLRESATLTHREVVNNIADAERLKALDPNIKRIEKIVKSSIMSPNDLQNVDPEITIETSSINPKERETIVELLKNFYCKSYDLRAKMAKWVQEAHYRSGAGVTMILPEATLTSLIDKYDKDRSHVKRTGSESLFNRVSSIGLEEYKRLENSIMNHEFLQTVMLHDSYKKDTPRDSSTASTEGLANPNYRGQQVSNTSDFKAGIESIVRKVYSDINVKPDAPKEVVKYLKSGIEQIAINFKKTIQDESMVNVVNNPDVCRVGKIVRDKQTSSLHNLDNDSILGKLISRHSETDTSMYYQDIPIMDITGDMTDHTQQKAFPFVLDLPTESVIPVCVPGSEEVKLGYFVMIDEFGQPVKATNYILSGGDNPISNRISIAYSAMYGDMPTPESGIQGYNTSTSSAGYMNDPQSGVHKNNLTKVFNYVLDEMIGRRLSEMGLSDVTVGMYNSIAQSMLFRLLEKKKTNLLFVPEKYITYMAFEHHLDGTGKSKIEDILYIESLKTCFMTANSLATMKSAVPVKKVKLNLEKEQTPSLQTLLMLKDAITQKEKFSPSIYPSTITSQAISQNLSIEMTHPNASDFTYTVEDTHREIPKADTDYYQELNKFSIIGLGMYPSALDETSEVQFAASLATTNLYYAQGVLDDQLVVSSFATKHVRNHLKLSSVLIYKIAEILTQSKKPNTDTAKDESTILDNKVGIKEGATSVSLLADRITDETWLKVLQVIDSVKISLCPPDIIVSNAQFNMLTEVIKRIDEYVNSVYPDDLATYGDADLSAPLRLLKAWMKSQLVREAASKIGYKGTLSKIPDMGEFIKTEGNTLMESLYGNLNGVIERINRDVKAMAKKSSGSEGEGEDDSSAW